MADFIDNSDCCLGTTENLQLHSFISQAIVRYEINKSNYIKRSFLTEVEFDGSKENFESIMGNITSDRRLRD